MEFLRFLRLQWDRATGAAAMTVGVIMLLLGWVEVSATEFVAAQIPYVISAGMGGIVAIMIGGTLWLSADLRDEWRALDRIDEKLAADDDRIVALEARLDALEAEPSGRSNGPSRRKQRTGITAAGREPQ